VLARGSVLKAVIMVVFGLLLATVGTDLETGQDRMTLGIGELSDGIDFAVLAMGVFGIAEILRNLDNPESRNAAVARIGSLLPSRQDLRRCFGPIVRATGIGSVLGILPGNGAVLGPFASYALEKKLAKDPRRFGRGAIEGVAGPEAANNGATAGAMVPLLSLGIPFSPATAILLGALMITGVQPGPLLISQRPEVFWGVVASMYVGNVLLLILNLPLVGLFVSVLRLPQHVLAALVLLLCLVGAYSLNNSPLDLWVLVVFGIFGYGLRKLAIDPSPLVVALVLGPLMEKTLRQALFMERGNFFAMLGRPLTLALVLIGVLAVLGPPIVRLLRRSAAPALSGAAR
jgi:putative tricarboxylic transport membrane protein